MLKLEPLGDRALLVTLGESLDARVNDQVHALAARMRERALPGLRDLVPAYATLAVHYDPRAWSSTGASPHEALAAAIRQLWETLGPEAAAPSRLVTLPVWYGGEWGPDLGEVAARCRLSEAEVIARHTAPEYRVFMLGFAPGFPYLGGLDSRIATPRRDTPRTRVPAGSVGIAGPQTGVYPLASPGGWQIIGRTPRELFQAGAEEPCLLRPGDRLRFQAQEPSTPGGRP
jgi:inhibitor of KinA